MSDVLWTDEEAIAATGGQSTGNWSASSIVIDSRLVEPQSMFFALPGEHVDGHDYVAAALDKGASVAVVSRKPDSITDSSSLLIVENVQEAMEAMALYRRAQLSGKVFGVTGSVGKTSVKEMLLLACRAQGWKSYATEGNLNNHLGLPISLMRTPKDVDAAIYELGMSASGEISQLSHLAKPDIAIITTVEAVHLEFFDSIEGIARAKSEITDGMASSAAVILNRDNPYYEVMHQSTSNVQRYSFGENAQADVKLLSCQVTPAGSDLKVDVMGAALAFSVPFFANGLRMNCLGVLACMRVAGADLAKVAEVLGKFSSVSGRGSRITIPVANHEHSIVIDDSYNASPASVTAALEQLAAISIQEEKRTIAVLGDMFELGDEAASFHADLSQAVKKNNVRLLFTIGELMYYLHQAVSEDEQIDCDAIHFDSLEAMIAKVEAEIATPSIVLVKGSRGMRMDRIVSTIQTSLSA